MDLKGIKLEMHLVAEWHVASSALDIVALSDVFQVLPSEVLTYVAGTVEFVREFFDARVIRFQAER